MLNFILLQATDGGGMGQLILFGGIAIVFYFFMIRPQQKKQKDQKKFLEEVKKGDSVVTIGGLHGKVVEIDAEQVVLDVDRGTKMTFERSSISLENSKRVQGKG